MRMWMEIQVICEFKGIHMMISSRTAAEIHRRDRSRTLICCLFCYRASLNGSRLSQFGNSPRPSSRQYVATACIVSDRPYRSASFEVLAPLDGCPCWFRGDQGTYGRPVCFRALSRAAGCCCRWSDRRGGSWELWRRIDPEERKSEQRRGR